MTILALENHIPAVAGMSVSFLVFALFAAYVIVNRPRILGEMWCHSVFIAAYAFIVVSALLEFSSPLSNYGEIIRFTQVIGGAVCVAVLCRDRSALTAGLYGYIGAALWVSVLLYVNSYAPLQGMGEASDFHQASELRAGVDVGIKNNLNTVGFVCIQGAIVAFALSFSERLTHLRILFLGITTFCLVASFLTMSRGTTVISLVSFTAILYAYGVRRYGKAVILVAILGLGVYGLVPNAVWSRMTFTTETQENGKMEARAYLYTTAFNRLPEYIVSGVGSGNFYQKWAFEKGFAKESNGVLQVWPAHNAILQITIMWGVFGLTMFLLLIWWVYRAIPLQCGRDKLSLALLGIIVSTGLYLLTSHVLGDKVFALTVGLLVGARQAIWPRGIVSAVDAQNEAVRQSSSQ